MKNIDGVIPVLPTVFNSKGEINFEDINNLIENLISGKVNGITIFGVGSEFYKLSENENYKILNNFINKVNNRIITIVSITQHSTKNACFKALEAQEAGANALMLLPPFFCSPDIGSVLNHISTVIKSVDIPIILQYAPIETNMIIPEDIFKELIQEYEDRIYFKIESKLPGALISNLVEKGAKILIGRGGINFYEALERGAVGVMPGCSLYDFFILIYNNYKKGEKDISFRLHNTIIPYLTFVDQSTELFLASEKYFLKLRGLITEDYCRAPFFKLDSKYKKILNNYKNIIIDERGTIL